MGTTLYNSRWAIFEQTNNKWMETCSLGCRSDVEDISALHLVLKYRAIAHDIHCSCQLISNFSQGMVCWRHQMETFSALLAICAGNSPVPSEFIAQRPVTRSFDVFFDLHPNKRLSKQWRAGDLRRYRAQYDVTVMESKLSMGCLKHSKITEQLKRPRPRGLSHLGNWNCRLVLA